MENNLFENRIDLKELSQTLDKLKAQISSIIVGQTKMIDYILAAILSNGHVLIEGVPGVAKTLSVKLLAKSISADFARIQFTPDLMPSDILGTSVFNMANSKFEFNKGSIFANMILVDEINRAPAKTQAALLEVMEERQVTIDGTTYKMDMPFIVFATQNPVEQEGTYRLPEAQLDRFLFKIKVDYPTLEEEIQILRNKNALKGQDEVYKMQSFLTKEQIKNYQQKIKEIIIEDNLIKYISNIINKTRNNNALYLGASPRASIAIMDSSKAFAAMQGRDFVTPEDIKEMAYPVMRHRIILSPEKEMEGISADEIIKQIINGIEIPR